MCVDPTAPKSAQHLDLMGLRNVGQLYAFTLVAIFLFSMGNKPKASEWKYSMSYLPD